MRLWIYGKVDLIQIGYIQGMAKAIFLWLLSAEVDSLPHGMKQVRELLPRQVDYKSQRVSFRCLVPSF
jgi:hypothetical protein